MAGVQRFRASGAFRKFSPRRRAGGRAGLGEGGTHGSDPSTAGCVGGGRASAHCGCSEETQAAEAQAEKDHLAFTTETGKSLAVAEEAESQRKAQLQDTEEKFDEAEANLQEQSGILRTSLKELLELKPACIDTGMSYADRVAMREEEIAALKKAMCILGKYAEYGPEGAADGC